MEVLAFIFFVLFLIIFVLYIATANKYEKLKSEFKNYQFRIESQLNNSSVNSNKSNSKRPGFDYGNIEYYKDKKINREYLYPIKNLEDTGNYFYGKKVVITGDFETFPDRNEMAKLLWEAGADVDTSVGKYTDVLIVGDNAGDTKIEYAEENDIEIMYEENFIEEFNL